MCQMIKSRPTIQMPLQPTQIGNHLWQIMFIDFIGPLPQDGPFNMIAIASDQLTKMIHLIPCSSTITAEETADLYLNHIWKLHGFPDKIISDRGPQFISKFIQT